ncbi:MAG: SEC-C metal-binding domain-containing protein [Thermodesulfobacteriota bacterium]
MPHIPAFCDNCGAAFSSGIVIENSLNVTLSGNKSGPCPACGSMGTIPDGVFTVTGNIIKLLAGPQRTIEQLQHLARVISDARKYVKEPNTTANKIKLEAPELSSIVDALPKTRSELYSFLTVILMAIGVVIAVYGSYKDREPTEDEIQKMIDQSIKQAIEESKSPKVLQPYKEKPKPGRNTPCPCGSGKKYKKCCGIST